MARTSLARYATYCAVVGFLLTTFHTQIHDEVVLRTPGMEQSLGRVSELRSAFVKAPFREAEAPRRSESLPAFADRKSYTRRLDKELLDACGAATRPSPPSVLRGGGACARGGGVPAVRLLQYNSFRAGDRGTSELIGAWLDARAHDYVTLNELNGFHNETEFREWGRRHGFASGFFLETTSTYHVGLLARSDGTCVGLERRVQGFAHGVLHVRCGRLAATWKGPKQPATHFFVTHLTPFDVASRSHEVQRIATMVREAMRDGGPEDRFVVARAGKG